MSLAEPWITDATRPRTAEAAPERSPQRVRRLRAVELPETRRRPRMAYGVVALIGALLIAGAQIALSMLTTQDSYRVADLLQERRDLTLQAQQLEDAVAGLSSPQYLAANAASMGMVIDSSPSYLRLSDGKLLGDEVASSNTSTVDPRSSLVGNALLSETPLTADPDRTLTGPIQKKDAAATDSGAETDAAADSSESAEPEPVGPPSIDDGLPSPQTH